MSIFGIFLFYLYFLKLAACRGFLTIILHFKILYQSLSHYHIFHYELYIRLVNSLYVQVLFARMYIQLIQLRLTSSVVKCAM